MACCPYGHVMFHDIQRAYHLYGRDDIEQTEASQSYATLLYRRDILMLPWRSDNACGYVDMI